MKRTLLITAILFSFVFTNGQSAKKIYTDIQNKKTKVLFHGLGTEPFWDFYILENSAIYAAEMLDEYEYWNMETTFDKSKYSQIIKLKNSSGEKLSVKIIKKSASDGMSPKKYAYTVIYGDRNGCGNLGY
jgi:uncharacterized membrane protein